VAGARGVVRRAGNGEKIMNDTARTRRLSQPDPEVSLGEVSFGYASVADDSSAQAARTRVISESIAPTKHRVVGIGGARNALAVQPGFSIVEQRAGYEPPPDPLSASEEWHRFADSHHQAVLRERELQKNAVELSAALQVTITEQKESDAERLATVARLEAEAADAGFERKTTYMLKVDAVNLPMTTVRATSMLLCDVSLPPLSRSQWCLPAAVHHPHLCAVRVPLQIRPYQLNYVTTEGIWHLDQYINKWDNPTLAVAPETLEVPLREIVFRFKQAKKDLDKEAKENYAKELKQKRKVDRLVRTYGEFEEQLEDECKEIQEAAAAEYAAIREPVMLKRSEDHAEAVAAGEARRRALEMSVEEQLAELSATVNKALNHKVWEQARDNRKVAKEIEGEMVETMKINLGPHDPHGAEEGARNYFEAVAGVEGRVRLDLKQQEQRDREEAERASEAAAVKAAHAAARRGRIESKRRQLASAEKVATWMVKKLVRDASRLGQANLDRAQAERDAAAKKFMEDFERQQAAEEAAANTPQAIAAREAQLLADAKEGKKKHEKYEADKGISYLQRRLAKKGKLRAQIEKAARDKAETEAAKVRAQEEEVAHPASLPCVGDLFLCML
jgi:hypothetical protein